MKQQRFLSLSMMFISYSVIAAEPQSIEQPPSLKVPETFGKSHFIVGMPREMTAACRVQPTKEPDDSSPYTLLCQGVLPQSFFSPHDDLRKALLHLIKEEKKSIKIAAYVLTDADIVKAVCDAFKKRGVEVAVVVDRSCLQMRGHKVTDLRKAGIPVAVFDGELGEEGAIMHNKFVLFGENMGKKSLVCTGSANITRSAYGSNYENVIVLDDPNIWAHYAKEFALLEKNARRMAKS